MTVYRKYAVILHWLIAGLIIFMLPLGFLMDDAPGPVKLQIFQLHKTIGLLILFFSLMRLGWRLLNPPPPPVVSLKPWERILAHLVHMLFYLIMIGMPLVGWAIVSTSSKGTPTLLFGQINWPHLAFLHNMEPVARKDLHHSFEEMHEFAAYFVLVLLVLHVGAALKHQFLDKDETMSRMSPSLIVKAQASANKGRGALLLFGGVLALFAAWIMLGGSASQPAQHSNGVAQETWTFPAGDGQQMTANWKVVKEQSQIQFTFSQSGAAGSGVFGDWATQIQFDPDDLSHARVVALVKTGSAQTGDLETDQSLPSPGWLHAAAFPVAMWQSTDIARTGTDQYVAHGNLRIRGVTLPLDLAFTLLIDQAGQAHMQGTSSLSRIAFGIGLDDDADASWVSDTVGLQIEIVADPVSN